MSDDQPQKRRKRKGSGDNIDAETPLTKEEKAVLKYLRHNLPDKEGKLMGNVVNIFIASEAIDILMESKWALSNPTNKKIPHLFPSRSHAVSFMSEMLIKQAFHRAEKIKKKSKKKIECIEDQNNSAIPKKSSKKVKQIEEKESKSVNNTDRDESADASANENKNDDIEEEEDEKSLTKKKSKEKKKDKSGRKARMKLEMHSTQLFVDGDSIYVWLYNPTSVMNIVLGVLVLVAIVGCCLFPLWPDQLRSGAYYLSLVAMGLLGVLMGLVVLRGILFGIVWCLTLGSHYFWFLPNLTEDCGVIESFKPLYSHEYKPSKKALKKD